MNTPDILSNRDFKHTQQQQHQRFSGAAAAGMQQQQPAANFGLQLRSAAATVTLNNIAATCQQANDWSGSSSSQFINCQQ